jgi:hypothetical protein
MVSANVVAPSNKDLTKDEINELKAASLATAEGNISGLFSFNSDKNETGFDFFFGAGSSLQSVKTINSARLGIESRARTLLSEIRMDQLRGVDTTHKREQLGALTGNLEIMNKNLGNNIDKAMEPSKPRESATPIIDKINAQLKSMQEAEAKKVQEKYGEREAPKEAEEPAPKTGDE